MKSVIKKMCTYVDVKFEDVDFKKENWYMEHSWTAEQEKKFCNWLVNEIKTNNDIRKELTTLSYRPTKKRVEEAVMWFNLMWGWKTEEKITA
jgi:hypothetical protein